MVKRTKSMRQWVTKMISPIPSRPYAAGMPRLQLDDKQPLGYCVTCGAPRLINELHALGGRCAECAEL
jgi:hypothetical protein